MCTLELQSMDQKLSVEEPVMLSHQQGCVSRNWSWTNYEHALKSYMYVELKKALPFGANFQMIKKWCRQDISIETEVTSGMTASELFQSFCYSGKLQKYNAVGWSLKYRYSIGVYEKAAAVSQSEI